MSDNNETVDKEIQADTEMADNGVVDKGVGNKGDNGDNGNNGADEMDGSGGFFGGARNTPSLVYTIGYVSVHIRVR